MNNILYGAIVVLAFVLSITWVKLAGRTAEVNMLKADIVVLNTEKSQWLAVNAEQNAKIEASRFDLAKKESEYLELVNKPAEVRYKTVYKTIPNIEVKSDECKDIKELLDNIRANGY
jgi:hypothetical protein